MFLDIILEIFLEIFLDITQFRKNLEINFSNSVNTPSSERGLVSQLSARLGVVTSCWRLLLVFNIAQWISLQFDVKVSAWVFRSNYDR